MTDQTPLDTAHTAMDATPDDDAARLRFFERLADSELFLLLQGEATGDSLSPAERAPVANSCRIYSYARCFRVAPMV